MRKQTIHLCDKCAVDCEVGMHGTDDRGVMRFNEDNATPYQAFTLESELTKMVFRDLKLDTGSGETLTDAFRCPLCNLSSFRRFRYSRELNDHFIVSATDKLLRVGDTIAKRLFICKDLVTGITVSKLLSSLDRFGHVSMSGIAKKEESKYKVSRYYRKSMGNGYQICVYGKDYNVLVSSVYDSPLYYGLDKHGNEI